jgi:hypothetical protein
MVGVFLVELLSRATIWSRFGSTIVPLFHPCCHPVCYCLGSPLVCRIGIWVDYLDLCLMDSDSLGLCPVDSGSLWLVIMPKYKDWFMDWQPMRIVQP